MTYELTEGDLDLSGGNPPCIWAARNLNLAVLSAILAEGARLGSQFPANTTLAHRRTILYPFSVNAYIPGSIYGVYTSSPILDLVHAANLDESWWTTKKNTITSEGCPN